jgi:hypothetical protein
MIDLKERVPYCNRSLIIGECTLFRVEDKINWKRTTLHFLQLKNWPKKLECYITAG